MKIEDEILNSQPINLHDKLYDLVFYDFVSIFENFMTF